ncbi:MAG: phosphodiester glycosidase family protein [Phaeodactylibacter sp.]|nr:phosphodiester glycosidase family protein [Phaeodactylibacter sp.]
MKFKNTLALCAASLLLLPSCATLYKKSTLFQEQEETIKTLSSDKKGLEEEVGQLREKLAQAAKDTVRETVVPPEMLVEDTIQAAQAGSDSILAPSFLDGLVGKEGWAAMKLTYRGAIFDILAVEDATDIQLFWKDEKEIFGNLQRLKKLAEREDKQLIFATNAGMYKPDRSPQGLYVENGEELAPLDTIEEAFGNFYLQPNGVFLIEKGGASRVVTTEEYENYRDRVLFATQSGPMAVIGGQINPKFNEPSPNVNIRSGVGVDPKGRTIFLISNQKINLYTFGSIFKEVFQCRNALYLDGAISLMYLPVLGRQDLGGDFGPLIGIMKSRKR